MTLQLKLAKTKLKGSKNNREIKRERKNRERRVNKTNKN